MVTFTVQYETTINGERLPVVRYDNAHGFPHRDDLDRWGQTIRKVTMSGNPDVQTALTVGQRDIQANWRRYRATFRRDDA